MTFEGRVGFSSACNRAIHKLLSVYVYLAIIGIGNIVSSASEETHLKGVPLGLPRGAGHGAQPVDNYEKFRRIAAATERKVDWGFNMSPRFINDIHVMRQLMPLLESYTWQERLQLTDQLNSFLSLPAETITNCKSTFRSISYQRAVVREALAALHNKVNVGSLHPLDIDKAKCLFLVLRRALIDFDPSDIRDMLVNEFGWEKKDANRLRGIATDIQNGVNPRRCFITYHWKELSAPWLESALTQIRLDRAKS